MNVFSVTVPEDVIETIAARAAELVLEQVGKESAASDSTYVDVREAAEFLRSKPQRVYDLLSSGRLTRFKDGARVLVSRAELDRYLGASGANGVAPSLPPASRSRFEGGVRR